MNNPWNINLVIKREFIHKNVIGTFIQKPYMLIVNMES